MKQSIVRLALAGALFSLLPDAAMADVGKAKKICRKFVKNEGYHDYKFKKINVTQARSGGYSVTGIIGKHGDRHEFNCVLSDNLLVQDLVINPLPGGGGGGSSDDGAPAEAAVACAEEGDRYWRVASGTTVPLSSKATGSGMYEVRLGSGNRRGVCTVTESGDVKYIMNK